MIYDFSFDQAMRLSSIKRWGIIEMSREQSVAEHSYNVALIAGALACAIFEDKCCIVNEVVEWALVHDMPELVSGDIPTPVKRHLGAALYEMEEHMFPKLMERKNEASPAALATVKLADFVDAIQFAQRFCIDPRKDRILADMTLKMNAHIGAMEKDSDLRVTEALEKVWPSARTRSNEA